MVSGLESGDKVSIGSGMGILKLRDLDTFQGHENRTEANKILLCTEQIEAEDKINTKKPPKFSPSRSGANYSKPKYDGNCAKESNSKLESGPLAAVANSSIVMDESFSSCFSSPVACQLEHNETPELVAPPPPGYFIRDYVSTDDEQTTICCNQNGDKILDNVPLCTFGYQAWSSMPYYCEVSPEGDWNCSPHSSPSPSPIMKKKDPPTKKTKKSKKRKRSISKVHDNPDFTLKKIYMEGNLKPKMKPEVDLKKGIALKQGSKKESTQAMRYRQKVINPKNPKLFQTMGNLPVSMDSVLYYYEPHGKQVSVKSKKKGCAQGKNNMRKVSKSNGVVKKKPSSKGKQEDILYLNTNENANNSDDLDFTDIKNAKNLEMSAAQSCNRQNGTVHLPNSYDTDLSDNGGSILPGDYSSLCFEELDSELKRKIVSDKESSRDLGELGKSIEAQNGPFSIDTMVNDCIHSAFKDELDYEQSQVTDKLESLAPKQSDDDGLTSFANNDSIVGMQCKPSKLGSKKSASTEKDKTKMQDRLTKLNSKYTNPKIETPTSMRQTKKKSISTPNIAVLRAEKEDSAAIDIENILQASVTSTSQSPRVKLESENMLCRSQTSPQLAYITVDAMNHDNVYQKDEMIGDNMTPQIQEDDIMETNKQKDRGRVKKTGQKTNSILRKPATTSQEDKRVLLQTKLQSKVKPHISLTKSHSLSPISKKRGGQINLGQPAGKKSKDSSDMSKKSGKKAKKKVRIVVDVNGIQPEKHPDDEFCEFRDDAPHGCGYYDGEIDEYLAGLMEKCKTENEQPQSEECADEHRKLELTQDSDSQHEKGDAAELAFCGFSESTSDQESLPCSPQVKESTPCPATKVTKEKKHKKSHKQVEKENREKNQAVEKERLQAEKGWDNNFIVQKDDSKTKMVVKKKRYQLKKAGDVKSEVDDFALLEKLRNSTDVDAACRKALSLTGNKSQKGPNNKKRSASPKQSRRGLDKMLFDQDPMEGSSVDAPGFNKKESGARVAKSSQAAIVSKQISKDVMPNPIANSTQAQRVKMARDNFNKLGRRKSPSPLGERYTSSLVDQVSPMASRSTDLDVAFSYRRQQLSPGRINALGRLARRDSKLGQGSKFRSKSESEEYKQKLLEACSNSKQGQSSSRFQHPDPMDMNVLNLGLSWMIQGLIKRFSIFKTEEKEEPLSSPVLEHAAIIDDAHL